MSQQITFRIIRIKALHRIKIISECEFEPIQLNEYIQITLHYHYNSARLDLSQKLIFHTKNVCSAVQDTVRRMTVERRVTHKHKKILETEKKRQMESINLIQSLTGTTLNQIKAIVWSK